MARPSRTFSRNAGARRRRWIERWVRTGVAAILLVGVGTRSTSAAAASERPSQRAAAEVRALRLAAADVLAPRLAAASSLAGVLQPWADARGVDLHPAATGVLVGQLTAGAPGDAVVLADPAWLGPLVEAGWCVADDAVAVAGNTLVLAGRGSSPMHGNDSPELQRYLSALAPSARVAIGDPEVVPAGRYAQQALTRLGLWDAWSARLLRAADAATAAAWVRAGAVDAAVVYATDVAPGSGLTVWHRFSPATHEPVTYLAVRARDNARGGRLVNALRDADTRAVFAAAGFAPAPPIGDTGTPAFAAPQPLPGVGRAVLLSLACAAAATALCFLPAVGLAAALTRRDRTHPGQPRSALRRVLRAAVEAVVLLPVVVPPVVCGWLVLRLLGPQTLGSWSPVFTWRGAAIAQALVALPFWVIALRAGLQQIDPAVLDAARCDGATRQGVLWHVALPLAAPGLGGRRAAGLRPGIGRVRGHHCGVGQHRRPHPHRAAGALHRTAGPRGRRAGRGAGRAGHRAGVRDGGGGGAVARLAGVSFDALRGSEGRAKGNRLTDGLEFDRPVE